MPSPRRRPLHLAPAAAEPPPEDRDLADALIAGERWAAVATYSKHAPMVYRFLHRALGSTSEAEDLTQEVFMRLFAKVHGLQDRNALRSFIFSIAIRQLKWELRRRRVHRILQFGRLEHVPEPAIQALDAASRDALRRLYAILGRLGALDRSAFVLRYIEQMTLEEVASAVGVSLATVKRRLDRATRLVSRAMDRDPSLAEYSKKKSVPPGPGGDDAVS